MTNININENIINENDSNNVKMKILMTNDSSINNVCNINEKYV